MLCFFVTFVLRFAFFSLLLMRSGVFSVYCERNVVCSLVAIDTDEYFRTENNQLMNDKLNFLNK